jgi:hypothetical protein
MKRIVPGTGVVKAHSTCCQTTRVGRLPCEVYRTLRFALNFAARLHQIRGK